MQENEIIRRVRPKLYGIKISSFEKCRTLFKYSLETEMQKFCGVIYGITQKPLQFIDFEASRTPYHG